MRSSDRDDEPAESAGLSRDPGAVIRRLLGEAAALDQAISVVVADTPTPTLDVPLTWVSNAANYSAIWVVIAVALAAKGGKRGRRAALPGTYCHRGHFGDGEPGREETLPADPTGALDDDHGAPGAHARVELVSFGPHGLSLRLCHDSERRVPVAVTAALRPGDDRRLQQDPRWRPPRE